MNSGTDLGPVEAGVFRTTRWSVVMAAGQRSSPRNQDALAKLYKAYWYPLYVYLRRRGNSEHEAQDLTQAFFARLLEKDLLAGVNVNGGKFRSFLLTALKRFAANEWARSQALKRGGDCDLLSLDDQNAEDRYRSEPVDEVSPEVLFERRWATTLLELVMSRLEEEQKLWRKTEMFQRLKVFLAGSRETITYREAGAELGMSEAAVKTAVHRLRRRYGELLREEIARTVGSPEEVEEEIRHLRSVLAG